jgi:hypothetical protein
MPSNLGLAGDSPTLVSISAQEWRGPYRPPPLPRPYRAGPQLPHRAVQCSCWAPFAAEVTDHGTRCPALPAQLMLRHDILIGILHCALHRLCSRASLRPLLGLIAGMPPPPTAPPSFPRIGEIPSFIQLIPGLTLVIYSQGVNSSMQCLQPANIGPSSPCTVAALNIEPQCNICCLFPLSSRFWRVQCMGGMN